MEDYGTDGYLDPSTLNHYAEAVDPSLVAETEDFFEGMFITPAGYLSTERAVKRVTPKDDGNVTVEIHFTSGLEDLSGSGRIYGKGSKYPLNDYLSSKLYGQHGQTCKLATYLKACGFEVSGKTVRELLPLVPESLNVPIIVRAGLQDKGIKIGTGPDGKGIYKSFDLRTRDFKNAEGKFTPTVTKEGQVVSSKFTVDGYAKVR
jgi:hypothetical protein